MCERCWRGVSRRAILVGAGALFAANAFAPVPCRAAQPQTKAPPEALDPGEALDRLRQGNARYAAGAASRDFATASVAEAKPQMPIAAVLACSDDPVPAELLFDQAPGALFVIRNAGNIVAESFLASLEYAVTYLRVPLLLVLGHTNCGAVATAFDAVRSRKELPGHLSDLVKAIEPAVIAAHAKHPRDMLGVTIEENVRINVKRLIEAEPVLSEALAAKTLAVSGGVHDVAGGKVRLI